MNCTGCSSAKLSEALRLARRKGLAIYRELGCRGCSKDEIQEAISQGQTPEGTIGAAFYTRYAAAEVADAAQRRHALETAAAAGLDVAKPPQVRLWLAHQAVDDKDAVRVAEILLECCREAGLPAEWNGHPGTAVAVYL